MRKEEALEYHSRGRKGKIEVISTKPCLTSKDLSLAYTPGVAVPCLEIQKDPEKAYSYTAKGNLVAVISNGTAVLGLGNIGAMAGKPVMEGKGILFKRFADIDVFDIELDTMDQDELIRTVQLLEPTFGGINLEDIKAPECFYIEEQLKKTMNIPVFHDDQHGTAIISSAALINAVELTNRKFGDIKMVVSGAGASAIACTNLYVSLGVKRENILMVDSKGVIYKGRKEGMNKFKEEYAAETECRTIVDAMKGADLFLGCSVKGMVNKDMIRSMNDRPIVFAMANPDPEITYPEAKEARDDIIMATGRSDYPNQVNNVLGFPFIFRGALDVRATEINEEMKIAAARSLAELAKKDVPASVCKAYGDQRFSFGPDYIIPKPFDHRVLIWEAAAVAEAAMKSGVAKKEINLEEYKVMLEERISPRKDIMRVIFNKAKRHSKRIVFPEGANENILRAVQYLVDENICDPILLTSGPEENVRRKMAELNLDLDQIQVINITKSTKQDEYAEQLYKMRQRKGLNFAQARGLCRLTNYFGLMMVHMGDADGLVSGLTMSYPETVRPAMEIVGKSPQVHKVNGVYIMGIKNRIIFFADTTMIIEPTAEDLAEIAINTAEMAKSFDIEPNIAMLSFSNFGSVQHPLSQKVAKAVSLVRKKRPDLSIDGEMQADTAVVENILHDQYNFCKIKKPANIMVFPDLQSGNIAYKLLNRLGGADAIGPILMGMRKPVNVLQKGDDIQEIVNIAAMTVVRAHEDLLR